jgi:hypothetical protein
VADVSSGHVGAAGRRGAGAGGAAPLVAFVGAGAGGPADGEPPAAPADESSGHVVGVEATPEDSSGHVDVVVLVWGEAAAPAPPEERRGHVDVVVGWPAGPACAVPAAGAVAVVDTGDDLDTTGSTGPLRRLVGTGPGLGLGGPAATAAAPPLRRFSASESKAMSCPLPEMDGRRLDEPDVVWPPAVVSDTRTIGAFGANRSRSNTSELPLVSFGTNSGLADENAAVLPSAESTGSTASRETQGDGHGASRVETGVTVAEATSTT